jgi:transcriptional regulator with XRE-family HTH domain
MASYSVEYGKQPQLSTFSDCLSGTIPGGKTPMHDAKWFGPRLREMREAAGMSRSELAGKAGVSERGIVQWERGEREPSWSMVLALCQALGVSCEQFVKEPGEKQARGRGRPPKAADVAQDERLEAGTGKQSLGQGKKGKGRRAE